MVKKGIDTFREAGYTKIQKNGKETVWFAHNQPDPKGRRCYCVVFQDMSVNDLIVMTEKQAFMLKLKHGDKITIADWTDMFNMQPDMIENMPPHKYGISISPTKTFEDIYTHTSTV